MNKSYSEIEVTGQVLTDLKLSHEFKGEKYYQFTIGVERQSGVIDRLPVIISERMMQRETILIGDYLYIYGSVRTKNVRISEEKTKLLVNIYAENFNELEPEENDGTNIMTVRGCICKTPILRTTPATNREVADFIICIYRNYGKRDYIPCIAWGKNAKYLSQVAPWTEIQAVGRFQSRDYIKVIDGVQEERTTYEMSISEFVESEVVDEQR